MVVILESLRKLVQSLVCWFAPVMFKKQKGERGEKERKGTRRRRQGQAREAEMLAAGSLEGFLLFLLLFFFFLFWGETEATGSSPCAAAFQTVKICLLHRDESKLWSVSFSLLNPPWHSVASRLFSRRLFRWLTTGPAHATHPVAHLLVDTAERLFEHLCRSRQIPDTAVPPTHPFFFLSNYRKLHTGGVPVGSIRFPQREERRGGGEEEGGGWVAVWWIIDVQSDCFIADLRVCECVWGKKGVSSRQITILNYACLSLGRSRGWGGRDGDGDEPRSFIPGDKFG